RMKYLIGPPGTRRNAFLLEDGVDRTVGVFGSGKRDVFEAAAEGVVVADRGPVDAERRVDRGGDVFGTGGAVALPAGSGRGGGGRRGSPTERCAPPRNCRRSSRRRTCCDRRP